MVGYTRGVNNTFNKLAGRTSLMKLSSHATGHPNVLSTRREIKS
jgi:hypothetical protein